jgi:mRNA interferase MazF
MSTSLNLSQINTVIIAVITSNLKYELFPGNVRMLKGEAGIPKASVINLSQVHSIDRDYIEAKIGSLSSPKLAAVKHGLALILDL